MKFLITIPVKDIREFVVQAVDETEAKQKVQQAIKDTKVKECSHDECDEDVMLIGAYAIPFKDGEESSWVVKEK